MQTLLDKQKTGLIKRFHTLLGKLNMDNEQKLEILAQYGVTSSKDMNAYELLELCSKLDKMSNPKLAELDVWRKRLIATIGAYLRAADVAVSNELPLIKKIACIAAKQTYFNKIPLDRLKALYNAFKNREHDVHNINRLTAELIANAGLTVIQQEDVEG